MNDRELLRRLADAFDRYDPVPADVRIDAELAGRLAPAASTLALVATGEDVRGADGPLLTFAGPAGRVDVQIEPTGPSVRLTGLLSGAMAVRVRWPTGEIRADVDGFGRFTVTDVPAGPLCVVVGTDGEPAAVGPWFVG